MINELGDYGWFAVHLAIVVLPIVNVMLSPNWEQLAKVGWVVAILCFNLFAYGVFLFCTANKVNRRATEAVRAAVPAARMSTLFVIGKWISALGRTAAVAMAIGIVGWVLIHLGDSAWMRESYWPWHLLVLFIYWLPVEIGGQILMALGRKLRPAPKSGA